MDYSTIFGIILVCISLSNVILKWLIIVKYPIYSPDEFVHLEIIRCIRRNKKVPKTFESFLIDKKYKLPFAYPFLSHYLFSFLPVDLLTKNRKQLVILLDSMNIILIGLFSFIFTESFATSIVIIGIYISIPFSFFGSLSFTPRVPSFFVINMIMCCFGVLHLVSFPLYIVLFISATILSISIFFLHKFTTQVLLVSLMSLFILKSYQVEIASILLLTFLTLIFVKRYYHKILKEHWGCVKKSYRFYKNQPLIYQAIKELINSVPFFAMLFFFIDNPSFFLRNEICLAFVVLMTGLQVFTYITTFLRSLRCIGEGERYLIHTQFPISFLLGYFLSNNYQNSNLFLILCALALPLCLFIIQFRQMIIKSHNKQTEKMDSLCKKIRVLPKNNVWIRVKGEPISSAVMYLAQKNVINCLNITFYDAQSESNKLNDGDMYSTLEKNPTKTIKEFQIDYILTDKETLTSPNSNINHYIRIIEEGKYYVLETNVKE